MGLGVICSLNDVFCSLGVFTSLPGSKKHPTLENMFDGLALGISKPKQAFEPTLSYHGPCLWKLWRLDDHKVSRDVLGCQSVVKPEWHKAAPGGSVGIPNVETTVVTKVSVVWGLPAEPNIT